MQVRLQAGGRAKDKSEPLGGGDPDGSGKLCLDTSALAAVEIGRQEKTVRQPRRKFGSRKSFPPDGRWLVNRGIPPSWPPVNHRWEQGCHPVAACLSITYERSDKPEGEAHA